MHSSASHEGIPSSVRALRQPLDPSGLQDDVMRGAAYRGFLRRTQDVIVSAVGYPGGFSALIRDRESITLRLVRLLRDE